MIDLVWNVLWENLKSKIGMGSPIPRLNTNAVVADDRLWKNPKSRRGMKYSRSWTNARAVVADD